MLLQEVPSWFEQQRQWKALKASSREIYGILLQQGLRGLGADREADSITFKDADRLYDRLWNQASPHKANSVCGVLRRVWGVMLRHEIVKSNPFSKMDLSSTRARRVMWSSEQVEEFIAASETYGLPAIGLLLHLCYTFGQRPGDMRQLKWSNYYEHGLHFTQEKTGKVMDIWVPPDIQFDLEQVERIGPYIVTREDTHNPFTSDDYQPIFRKVREIAMLPKFLQLRDARRSATTELEEAGATDAEIQSVTGHDRRSTLNVYGMNTQKTSKNALNKRFNR